MGHGERVWRDITFLRVGPHCGYRLMHKIRVAFEASAEGVAVRGAHQVYHNGGRYHPIQFDRLAPQAQVWIVERIHSKWTRWCEARWLEHHASDDSD